MRLLKTMAVIAVMIVMTFTAADVRADQGVSKETEDGGIMTGLVIAYGEILKPPYYITYNLDTVFINGIRVVPGKGDSTRVQPEIVVTETSRIQHNLIKEMSRIYYETYKKHGIKKAETKLLEKYKGHKLLAEFEIKDGDAYFRFKGEKYGEWNMLKSNLPTWGKDPYTPEQMIRLSESIVESWRRLLEAGITLTFCYGYHKGAYQKDKTDEMLELIKGVETDAISKADAKKEVKRILDDCEADELWNK